MIGAHGGDRLAQPRPATLSDRRKDKELLLLHVDLHIADQLLDNLREADRRIRCALMDVFDTGGEGQEFLQLLAMAGMVAGLDMARQRGGIVDGGASVRNGGVGHLSHLRLGPCMRCGTRARACCLDIPHAPSDLPARIGIVNAYSGRPNVRRASAGLSARQTVDRTMQAERRDAEYEARHSGSWLGPPASLRCILPCRQHSVPAGFERLWPVPILLFAPVSGLTLIGTGGHLPVN